MTAADRPTEPPVECVAVDRDERCLCPGGPASHRPSPPAPAAEDDAVLDRKPARNHPDAESPAPNVATSEGRDKAVARSGEQPDCGTPEETDGCGACERCCRPAPVVPDGGHVLTEYGTTSCPVEIVRAEVVDGKCSACGAVVPGSTDVRDEDWWAIRVMAVNLATDVEAIDAEWAEVCVAEQEKYRALGRIARGVLAVVGQGVTAAQAWDECVQAVAWAMDNGPDPLRYVAEHNPYRAVVRSGEQGGEA